MNSLIQAAETIQCNAPGAGVWRDIARLAAEALAIGLAFSLLLVLAVFMVAHNTGDAGALRADMAAPAIARTI